MRSFSVRFRSLSLLALFVWIASVGVPSHSFLKSGFHGAVAQASELGVSLRRLVELLGRHSELGETAAAEKLRVLISKDAAKLRITKLRTLDEMYALDAAAQTRIMSHLSLRKTLDAELGLEEGFLKKYFFSYLETHNAYNEARHAFMRFELDDRAFFADALPAAKTSWAKKFPYLEKQILRIESDHTPDFMVLAWTQKEGLTTEKLLDAVRDARLKQAEEMRLLAVAYRDVPLVRDTLVMNAAKLDLDEGALRRFDENKDRFKGQFFDIDNPNSEVFQFLLGYASAIPGQFGELKVALRLPQLICQGCTVGNLVSMQKFMSSLGDSVTRDAVIKKLTDGAPHILGKEIDVIFNEGRAWGEVKNFREPITRGIGNWDEVINQARKMLKLRSLMNRGVVHDRKHFHLDVQEMHYFVINGISEGAAAELEALGYVVHGMRVP